MWYCDPDFIGWALVMYFILIPLFYNLAWQQSKLSFVRWYFKKSESVNWLGYALVLVLGLGSFIYYILELLLTLIFYVIVMPISWLFEFIFLNKNCNHLACEELENKIKEGNK